MTWPSGSRLGLLLNERTPPSVYICNESLGIIQPHQERSIALQRKYARQSTAIYFPALQQPNFRPRLWLRRCVLHFEHCPTLRPGKACSTNFTNRKTGFKTRNGARSFHSASRFAELPLRRPQTSRKCQSDRPVLQTRKTCQTYVP